MAKNEAEMKTVDLKKMSPIRRVLHKNVPWLWYLGNMVVSLFIGSLTAGLPEVEAQIMAGEIFDTGLLISFVLLSIFNVVLGAAYSASVTWAGYYTERNIQNRLWGKLIRLPMREYEKQAPSSLISRVTSDTTQASTFLTNVLQLIYLVFTLIMVIGTILSKNLTIALLLCAIIPYIAFITIVPGKLRFKTSAQKQTTFADFTSVITQRLNAVRRVKGAAMEDEDIDLCYEAAKENYRAEMKYALADCGFQPFAYLAEAMIFAIILIMGGHMVQNDTMTQSDLVAMFIQGNNVYAFTLMIISIFYMFKDVQGATQTIGELMLSEDEPMERTVPFTQSDDDIVLEHVNFSYEDREVLKDLSFTIPNGKTTAIVGPSGAGKTTLLSILERLYLPSSGTIRFGDTPVEDIHLDQWRNAIGYVQQNSSLLSGTIRENIAYGLDRPVSDEELIHAAKLSHAYDFIEKLPDGLDTEIGQLGGKLSGGERQRIAISRMIIREPDYLLLDEATCNLDAENEAQVQSSINEMVIGRTAVIVAHNLRTILDADQIVVLDNGCVQASGTHAELYQTCELYKKYIDLQFTEAK
ncbi:MAG: ABC transporter ATP-binding protein/permease [Oscillospiraceae bacterium]|nr:ABC transporter ATP-binding protein/permease [Oscillospiraceae bacterium]